MRLAKHQLDRLVSTVFLASLLASGAGKTRAQETSVIKTSSTEAAVVVGAVNSERLRISAPSAVVQLRLEVYDQMGTKIFDTEQRGGNVLDWHLQGGNGERVNDGSYLCVTTVKDLKGRLRQKLGRLIVDSKTAVLSATKLTELAAPQAQAVGPIEGEDESLTVLADGDSTPATVLTNSGSEAQLARTRGALSFRLGDFFRGNDQEQMRLTEDGNLGIGTAQPQFKLDVVGTIRAERILIAKPRQTATKDQTATAGDQNADGGQPLASGTGTQNRIAKWTDNAGTLGNSNIIEDANNLVGIGTTNPGSRLHIVGAQGVIGAGTFQLDAPTLFSNWTSTWPAFEVLNTNQTDNNVSLFQFSDVASGAAHAGIGAVATSHVNKFGDLFFFTKGTDGYQLRMGIYGGKVGIGTTTPTSPLDVAGDINTSTGFNIAGSRVFSSDSVNGNLFVGTSAGANTTGGGNNFFGLFAGFSNTTGVGNNFFGNAAGVKNTTGGLNSFFGHSAGNRNTAGNRNSFFGDQSGDDNTTASFNAFFGAFSGHLNTTGASNAFFGYSAGLSNTAGGTNAFFGANAGQSHATGDNNAFFGYNAGSADTSGNSNAFFGSAAGNSNTTGTFNTVIGGGADVGSGNLTNATAIGWRAVVAANNSLVLGAINGLNSATVDTNVGIGTPTPTFKLHLIDPSNTGLRVQTNTTGGTVASFGEKGAFQIDTTGVAGGRLWVTESGNVAIGSSTAPTDKLYVNGDTRVNGTLRVPGGSIFVANPNTLIITSPNGFCWGITVNNSGVLSTFSATCP